MKLLPLILATSVLCASSAYAAVKVEFQIGVETAEFSCTASNKAAVVNINSVSVDINGACGGVYVPAPGHITNLPASVLNSHFFQIKKSALKAGRVEVQVSKGTLNCSQDRGEKRVVYGDGRYCLMQK